MFLPPTNEVCEGYVFTRVSRPTPSGDVDGSGWGVSRPSRGGGGGRGGEVEGSGWGGGLQAHTWGVSRPRGIPACSEADTPHSRWLLLREVYIILEYILVTPVCHSVHKGEGSASQVGRSASRVGGLHREGSASRGEGSASGGGAGWADPPSRIRSTSERYASY